MLGSRTGSVGSARLRAAIVALVMCMLGGASGLTPTWAEVIGTATPPAVDVIVVMDNSGSMGAEVAAVETELYDHLVAPLLAAGLDTQVVVVARYGIDTDESACFEAPLSPFPVGTCATPPAQPAISDLFKHYSVEVASHNAWCLVQSTFTVADEFGLAPAGWSAWLRADAFKVFLMVSDDGVTCDSYADGDSVAGGSAAAAAIDTDLLALSPGQFGSMADRRYVVHPIIGVDAPLLPGDPITTNICFSAVDPGTGHQGLSILTGGLRFPTCEIASYGAYLEAMAEDTLDRLGLFFDGFESAGTDAWSTVGP